VSATLSEFGHVLRVTDIVPVIVRIVAGIVIVIVVLLMLLVVTAHTEEPHKSIADRIERRSLELIEMRMLGDIRRVQNLPLVRLVFVPPANKVLKIHETFVNRCMQ
jgi:hypothetical protein